MDIAFTDGTDRAGLKLLRVKLQDPSSGTIELKWCVIRAHLFSYNLSVCL